MQRQFLFFWVVDCQPINKGSPTNFTRFYNFSTRDQDQIANAEDVLFDMFKNEDTGLLAVGKFLAVSTFVCWRNVHPICAFVAAGLKASRCARYSTLSCFLVLEGSEDNWFAKRRPQASRVLGQFAKGALAAWRSRGHLARDPEVE